MNSVVTPSRPAGAKTAVNRHASNGPERPHLSYSQLKTFSQCPLQWWLSRRYAPAFVSAALVFGGGFHAAVEAFHQGRLEGRVVAIGDMLAVFDALWRHETETRGLPVKFTAKAEDAAAMRALAERMLAAYVAAAAPGEVVALEEKFEMALASDLPPVVGKIDLIELRVDPDGVKRVHLVDFKTAARKPSWDDIDADQLLLYALAARKMGWLASLGAPVALRYDYTTKTKTPEVVSIPVEPSGRGTRRFIEKARQCWRGMSAGIVYPTPGWTCGGCGHAGLCARWPALPAGEVSMNAA